MILDGALQFTGIAGVTTPGSGTGQNTAGMGDDPMLTAITASNNVLDLLNSRDMGIGDDPALKVVCSVTVAGVGGTSMQIAVQGSPDNSTWVTMATGPTVLTANLLVGTYIFAMDMPRIAGALPDRPAVYSTWRSQPLRRSRKNRPGRHEPASPRGASEARAS